MTFARDVAFRVDAVRLGGRGAVFI
jgi:hypothetical protein